MKKTEKIAQEVTNLLPWEVDTPQGYVKVRGPQEIWMFIPDRLAKTKEGMTAVRDMYTRFIENYEDLLIMYQK